MHSGVAAVQPCADNAMPSIGPWASVECLWCRRCLGGVLHRHRQSQPSEHNSQQAPLTYLLGSNPHRFEIHLFRGHEDAGEV